MQNNFEFRQEILTYATSNSASFETGSVASNEIYFFEYSGKKYVLKKPLMREIHLSPFWFMMKNLFHFSFEKQYANFQNVTHALRENPHIPTASFVAADNRAMIFEFLEGGSRSRDEFPRGHDNAYRLGQYAGYNHQCAHTNCGLMGVEDIADFFPRALSHMEACINSHWNSNSETDQNVRARFNRLKKQHFESSKNSLIMVDISADQFLYDEKENIVACVDLDAYVIGPVEWELSFLHRQVEDWNRFRAGYENYQDMPPFEEFSDFFLLLMALNLYNNKHEIRGIIDD